MDNIDRQIAARNVLSRPVFDLQLFGGGGGGKSGGKLFASILFGAIGFFYAGPLFGAKVWGGALLGASIGGTLWSATHRPSINMGETGSPDVQRFDRAQEQMSSDGQIPVVYGYRKITGNQTFHETNAEANKLHKHVVLCEGGIEGIVSVTANDLLIPTGNQSSGAVFVIQNLKYKDACCSISNKHLSLGTSEGTHDIYLCNKDDMTQNASFYEWQTNISALIAYINRIGEGWQAFPTATTTKLPGDLSMAGGNCYNNPIKVTASTVTGGTNYKFHDCESPDNYNDVGGYPNLAWLDMNFTTSPELNGNPSVSAIVKGKKVYDIRTGRTEYSTNPAMCLLDFLTSKRYGLGKWITMDDIDKDSWTEAADYCDEVIEFHNADNVVVKAKRYELNMVIDQKSSALNWVQEILANFCGYLTIADGKYKLKIEKKTPISYRFDDSNCRDLSITPMKLSETPNKYCVKLVDPLNNWTSVAALCEDYADQKERGRVITKEVQLNGVTSQNQALRLARFYRDYNLSCPLTVSFKTGYQAMHLEAGDVVTVAYHEIFEGLPIRISQIKENRDGEFEITGRQYNPDIYSDDLGGGIHWYNYITDNSKKPSDPPAQVSNLRAESQYRLHADGKTGYDIQVTFTLPKRWDVNEAVVYYQKNNATADELTNIPEGVPADQLGFYVPWKEAGVSSGRMVIPGVALGDEYNIKVRARSDSGRLSDNSTAPVVLVTVQKRTTVPSQPQNLRYDFSERFLVSWDDVPDADVLYYEVRTDNNVGATAGLLGRTASMSLAVSLQARYGKIYVFAVNEAKRASHPAIVSYKYPEPPVPTSITISKTPMGISAVAPPLPATCHRVAFYVTSTNYSERFEYAHPVLQLNEAPGIYDIRAAYIDLLGEGPQSDIFTAVIEPSFDPAWIADGSISMAKFDGLAKSAVQSLQDTAKKLNSIDHDVTELQKRDGEIQSLVIDTKSELASQIKQVANGIEFTVSDSRQGLASDIQQNADKIQQVIAQLNETDPSKSVYSSITQLVDGINARVAKGDIINQINMTADGTTIDGKYVHITGRTKFDDSIITDKMIKAGAITADKLAAGSIAADRINVKELSALTAKIGLLRTKDTGARVEISDNLIKVYDENNILRVKLGVW